MELREDVSALANVPRFYFHLHNDMDVTDVEGIELPDLAAARALAVQQARVTFAETAKETGRIVLHHRIDIADEGGAILVSVKFGEAVKVEE